MGSSNREYMQEDYEPRGSSWGHDIPTTKWLLIVTVVVFLLQTVTLHEPRMRLERNPVVASVGFDGPSDQHVLTQFRGMVHQTSYIEDWFELDADKVLQGQVWRLVTFIFCHPRNSLFYLLFNMLALYYFGAALERMYGSREILWFYLASGAVCGLVFTAVGTQVELPKSLMGAGSCAGALLTLYATHFPRQEIMVMWLFSMEIRYVVLIYAIIDSYTVFQAYSGEAPVYIIAYLSDLWGIVFGYLYRKMDWHLQGSIEFFDVRRAMRSFRRASASRNLKVYHPEPAANLDEQVDAILAKIHEQGSDSLTERERVILQKASERAKNRQ